MATLLGVPPTCNYCDIRRITYTHMRTCAHALDHTHTHTHTHTHARTHTHTHTHTLCITLYIICTYIHVPHSGPLRRGEVGVFPWGQTNRGPGALVNANVDACTASYYNPFCVTKMHKITLFFEIFSGGIPPDPGPALRQGELGNSLGPHKKFQVLLCTAMGPSHKVSCAELV